MRTRWKRSRPTRLLLTLVLAAAACAEVDPRRVVAEQFIDRLFVVIDQVAARELATGLAAAKLDEEIRLTAGQEIDEGTLKPRVRYTFEQLAAGTRDDTTSLVYELHIAPEGVDAFSRRLILTMRRDGERWRVANYTLESAAEPD